jgi:hypothetical protein
MARYRFVLITACMVAVACSPAPERSSGPAVHQVEPRPGMAEARPVAWERADVGQDGRTLQVLWRSGPAPCFVFDHVDLAQSPQAVTVTIYEGRDPKSAASTLCPTILITKATTVALDAPLDGRTIIDGTKGHRS